MCLLAYAASLHLIACIAINLIVPFLLILIHSSQFSPKGYFAYTMLFCLSGAAAAGRCPHSPGICRPLPRSRLSDRRMPFVPDVFQPPENREKEVRDSLMELACLLTQIADREIPSDAAAKMESLELKFQNYSYQSHRLFSKSRRHSQIYDMLAILFQRAAYLVTDDSWHVELNGKHTQYLRRLSSFLGRAAGRFSLSTETIPPLTAEARELLDDMPLSNGRLRIFSRSFLHMLILLMQTLEQVLPQDVRHRRPPLSRRLKKFTEDLKCRCRLEAFEFRFALRCALVIAIGYVISMLLPLPRAYWLPINAFILIQPSMEESEHRMRTRPIGTVLGCLVEAVGPTAPGNRRPLCLRPLHAVHDVLRHSRHLESSDLFHLLRADTDLHEYGRHYRYRAADPLYLPGGSPGVSGQPSGIPHAGGKTAGHQPQTAAASSGLLLGHRLRRGPGRAQPARVRGKF